MTFPWLPTFHPPSLCSLHPPAVDAPCGFVFQNPDHQVVMPTVAADVAFGLGRWAGSEGAPKGGLGCKTGTAGKQPRALQPLSS